MKALAKDGSLGATPAVVTSSLPSGTGRRAGEARCLRAERLGSIELVAETRSVKILEKR